MKKIQFLCHTLLIALMLCAVPLVTSSASGSRGLVGDHMTKPSSNSDVAMIFYKLIKQQPPFDLWITKQPAYQALDPSQRESAAATEMARLETAFKNTDATSTSIIVRVAVKVKIKTMKGAMLGQPGKKLLTLVFPVTGSIYFPYVVPERTIAVIPNGIDLYQEIPVTDDEAKAIQARMDLNGNSTLVMEIAPRMADGTQPMEMDGVKQWLLFGEIGFIALYNNYLEMLWSYQSPAYKVQGQDALLNLRAAPAPGTAEVPVAPVQP